MAGGRSKQAADLSFIAQMEVKTGQVYPAVSRLQMLRLLTLAKLDSTEAFRNLAETPQRTLHLSADRLRLVLLLARRNTEARRGG